MTDVDVAQYALRLGDDALVAAQRLGEWSARAHDLEEDIALSNIALDQLGAARLLLSYAGTYDGRGEDDLAYLRGDAEFRNCLLVEQANGDFATTIAKLLLLATWQQLLYAELAGSSDTVLAEIAAKTVKESRYHADHALQWTVRLGDGTGESHDRMQAAIDEIWPYGHELFLDDELTARLAAAGVAPQPSTVRPAWLSIVDETLAAATLTRPADGWRPVGGRTGRHTEALSYLLAEMQVLHRAHPGASW